MLIQSNLSLFTKLPKHDNIYLTFRVPLRHCPANMKSKVLTYFHTLKGSYDFLAVQIQLVFKAGLTVISYFASSNINEVITTILNSLSFFYEKILHAQKPQKSEKAQKTQRTQKAQDARKNDKNANKRITDFFPLDIFYAHKNVAFFVVVRLYAFLCLIKLYNFNLIYKPPHSLIVSTHILTKRRM